MTTAAIAIAIRDLLKELEGRIKNREDAALYQQIYTKQRELDECHRKEKEESDKRHAEAIAQKDKELAALKKENATLVTNLKRQRSDAPRKQITIAKGW